MLNLAFKHKVISKEVYLTLAAFNGHLEILQDYVHELPVDIAKSAAKGGQLEVLKWLNTQTVAMQNAMSSAARVGNIEILQWGLQNGLELNAECNYQALKHASLKVCDWLLKHDCPWCDMHCTAAIKSQDLAKLEWTTEYAPYGLDENDVFYAAHYDNLNALKWIYQKEPELVTPAIMEASMHQDVIEWGLSLGFELTPECMANAVGADTLDFGNWLRKHNCPINTNCWQVLMELSIFKDTVFIQERVDWLQKAGCELPPDFYALMENCKMIPL